MKRFQGQLAETPNIPGAAPTKEKPLLTQFPPYIGAKYSLFADKIESSMYLLLKSVSAGS